MKEEKREGRKTLINIKNEIYKIENKIEEKKSKIWLF